MDDPVLPMIFSYGNGYARLGTETSHMRQKHSCKQQVNVSNSNFCIFSDHFPTLCDAIHVSKPKQHEEPEWVGPKSWLGWKREEDRWMQRKAPKRVWVETKIGWHVEVILRRYKCMERDKFVVILGSDEKSHRLASALYWTAIVSRGFPWKRKSYMFFSYFRFQYYLVYLLWPRCNMLTSYPE